METDFKKDNIKLFVFDFDGIFTDGKLTVYSDGKTSKIIDYKDIMAIANLIKANKTVVIISGEKSSAIDLMKQNFPSIEVFQNIRNKLEILEQMVKKYDLKSENVFYMGDDINDVKCLEYAKIPCTVKNAHKSILSIKNIYITKNYGGNGAVREIVDLLL